MTAVSSHREPARPLGGSYVRGHPTMMNEDGRHVFTANPAKAVPAEGGEEPPCPFCGLVAAPGGPDPCMGELPRVESACCGHGEHEGWIRFEGGPQLAVRIDYPGAWSSHRDDEARDDGITLETHAGAVTWRQQPTEAEIRARAVSDVVEELRSDPPPFASREWCKQAAVHIEARFGAAEQ